MRPLWATERLGATAAAVGPLVSGSSSLIVAVEAEAGWSWSIVEDVI